jgi:hypothetical protein
MIAAVGSDILGLGVPNKNLFWIIVIAKRLGLTPIDFELGKEAGLKKEIIYFVVFEVCCGFAKLRNYLIFCQTETDCLIDFYSCNLVLKSSEFFYSLLKKMIVLFLKNIIS